MIIIFTIIMAVGIIIQTAAQNMTHMVVGRFVAGIGNGNLLNRHIDSRIG